LSLQDRRRRMPAVRQLGQLSRFFRRQSPLAADGEMDPAATTRAPPREARIVPPGPHQGVMNRPAISFQPEVDGLHPLVAVQVWAGCFAVHDVGCHVAPLAPLAIQGLHLLQLIGFWRIQGFWHISVLSGLSPYYRK